MHIVSIGDKGNILHEMSKPIFWSKQIYINTSSAENITQSAKR